MRESLATAVLAVMVCLGSIANGFYWGHRSLEQPYADCKESYRQLQIEQRP